MITKYAIVHRDGLVLDIVNSIELVDGVYKILKESKDPVGMGLETYSLDISATELVNPVKFDYDETTGVLVNYYEGEVANPLNFQMTKDLFWRLENSGLKWVDSNIEIIA
jgi:hypothetical protein